MVQINPTSQTTSPVINKVSIRDVLFFFFSLFFSSFHVPALFPTTDSRPHNAPTIALIRKYMRVCLRRARLLSVRAAIHDTPASTSASSLSETPSSRALERIKASDWKFRVDPFRRY